MKYIMWFCIILSKVEPTEEVEVDPKYATPARIFRENQYYFAHEHLFCCQYLTENSGRGVKYLLLKITTPKWFCVYIDQCTETKDLMKMDREASQSLKNSSSYPPTPPVSYF